MSLSIILTLPIKLNEPKVIIEKVVLTKIGLNVYDLAVTVREVGGASTAITRVEIVGGNLNAPIIRTAPNGGNSTLRAGQRRTLAYIIFGKFNPGITYYIRVYYDIGEGEEATDLYPVTVR